MLAPIFTHGTYDNTINAITDGKIKYPAYCWITDRGQYGFLNKQNQLEIIGIPEFTGTMQNPIILSSLDDGLYQIKGQHKITAEDDTTFYSMTSIICVVQTLDEKKKIKRITADEIIDYVVNEDLSVARDIIVTESYLESKGYVDAEYVDRKIAAMEQIIKDDIEAALPEMIEPIVRPVVEDVVDDTVQDIPEEDIEDLFHE